LDLQSIEISLIIFFTGLFIGFITAFFVIKFIINRKVKSIYRSLNNLLLFKLKYQKELRKRNEALFILTNRLKSLKENLSKSGANEYSNYLNDLNQILSEKGITKISDKKQ